MHAQTPIADPGAVLDMLIVGAGISGIGMAAHLTRACPDKRFAIIERRERPGGTWDLFRYPGIRSDSDMFTLGFSFAPWKQDRSIVGGEAILRYLDEVIDDHGLREHMRLGQSVVSADWDEATGFWTVRLEDAAGQASTQRTRFLFVGSGYYDYEQPHDAQIAGLDSFAGTTIHPQFWPEDFNHAGKRIVVIGSGATAATLVPALAEKAAHVIMLQRTPTWYLNRPADDKLAGWLRRLLPAKAAYALTRLKNVRMQNYLFAKSREAPEGVMAYLREQLQEQLGADYEREHFEPPYAPWEQRMCLIPDGDLFAALRSGSAEIVTAAIDRVDETGIRLKDGRHLDADVIVTATGLRVMLLGRIALSLNGVPVNLADHFYYRHAMFSNVPNFAALFGYLNASWTLRVDMVAEWLCRLLRQMDAWHFDVATPYLPADHALVEDHPFESFSSGYLARGRHLIPRNATTAPWQIGMNYMEDRKALRDAPIDDGALRFGRVGARVAYDASTSSA